MYWYGMTRGLRILITRWLDQLAEDTTSVKDWRHAVCHGCGAMSLASDARFVDLLMAVVI